MITTRSRPLGTGAEIIIEGDDKDAVQAKAESLKDSIDYMRSPNVAQRAQPTDHGTFVARVIYYGLD